ncbi:MAG: phosphate ABC transporter ATP-binding protein [Cellulosilyticaceae bacterium]
MTTALHIHNLTVSFGKETILKSIDLEIPKHRITAIIGCSGCGKSTLLKSINRISEEVGATCSGELQLGDQNLFTLPKEHLRTKIGLVFQTPVVFPFSILKNITYALNYHTPLSRQEATDKAIALLKQTGLYNEIKDVLHKPATKLSGGQQQRLAITRALAVTPELLLLDEPCSALDIKSTTHIEALLTRLKKDYTIVIVTHNLAQASRIADHVVFMDDGCVIETGPATQVLHAPLSPTTQAYLAYQHS